jgi:hypothetical protein
MKINEEYRIFAWSLRIHETNLVGFLTVSLADLFEDYTH